MVKMGIPYLPHSRSYSQEQESRCNLAITYLAILIGHLTLFSVPLHLKPLDERLARIDRALPTPCNTWQAEGIPALR
jgi:hypothetical protein